jgi:hypothetical protein
VHGFWNSHKVPSHFGMTTSNRSTPVDLLDKIWMILQYIAAQGQETFKVDEDIKIEK